MGQKSLASVFIIIMFTEDSHGKNWFLSSRLMFNFFVAKKKDAHKWFRNWYELFLRYKTCSYTTKLTNWRISPIKSDSSSEIVIRVFSFHYCCINVIYYFIQHVQAQVTPVKFHSRSLFIKWCSFSELEDETDVVTIVDTDEVVGLLITCFGVISSSSSSLSLLLHW